MKFSLKFGRRRANIVVNQKVIIFCFCFFISFIFWALIKLSENYITTITYPVNYTNFPDDKINANDLPNKLKLKVSAKGFDIVKYKFSSTFIPIKLDISELEFQYKDKDSTLNYILTNNLLQILNNQLSEKKIIQNIDVIDISPDTIFFEFTPVDEKKIPVGLNADITFLKQYMLKDKISITPDSVTITGPKNMIDTMFYAETEFLSLKDLKQTYSSDVKLVLIKKVIYSSEKVKVDVPVEEYTEKKITVPILVINVPDSLKMKIFPNELNINYLIGFSSYNKVDEGNFEVYVDYFDIEKSFTQKIKVKIKNSPTQIKSFDYSPASVEYIIEK